MSNGVEPNRWLRHWQQLVSGLVRVESKDDQRQLLQRLARPVRPTVVAFANAHAMNMVSNSRAFFHALRSADLVLRDGSGMAILMKLLNLEPGLNLNGTDLIPRIARRFNGRSIALFGTQEPYLSRASDVLLAHLAPQSTCVTANGFLQTAQYVRLAQKYTPELIILGMGMPRQEEVARELRAALTHPCLIVCGGAVIDFLGGKTPRAPRWMRAGGIEWMYRLALEPRRLFNRYVIGNPLFIARAVRLAIYVRKPARGDVTIG